jgi:Txe/YoeB family toxin of Txe-Axe toxin-antitoxin module
MVRLKCYGDCQSETTSRPAADRAGAVGLVGFEEVLHGKLAGRHSIRVNDQFRIVFKWQDGNAHEVRLTDYH